MSLMCITCSCSSSGSQSLGSFAQSYLADGCYPCGIFWQIWICTCFCEYLFRHLCLRLLGRKGEECEKLLLPSFCLHRAPKLIKTDNGPAYTHRGFQLFCGSYDILNKTGIPYNSQGQAIVEWAHQTLKDYIHKTKKG